MAREKMFDSTFQKVFTEAIVKENKIRERQHLEEPYTFPHWLKVTWDDISIDSSDDDEDSSLQNYKSCTGDVNKPHRPCGDLLGEAHNFSHSATNYHELDPVNDTIGKTEIVESAVEETMLHTVFTQ
ncbi:uncharacterized protein [Parasteatoda tepidariorum]|uniref:uncharacterized protein isoform X2 n=1 Tax=Parasteatoda tepidariorum TaxID=114398 RepID=UPI0039BC6A85